MLYFVQQNVASEWKIITVFCKHFLSSRNPLHLEIFNKRSNLLRNSKLIVRLFKNECRKLHLGRQRAKKD